MLTIGKPAKSAEVGIETIRFHEREGLLAPAGRKASGYRQYSGDAVMKRQFICMAMRLGFHSPCTESRIDVDMFVAPVLE